MTEPTNAQIAHDEAVESARLDLERALSYDDIDGLSRAAGRLLDATRHCDHTKCGA